MSEKILLRLIALSFGVIVLGLVLSFYSYDDFTTSSMIDTGSFLAQLFGFTYLFKESTIKGTVYWKAISGLLSVLCIGILFKIMHWAFQEVLLAISLFGIPIVYFFRFFKKDKKNIVDILKVFWVFAFGIITFLTIFHVVSKDFRIIHILLFWILFAVAGFREHRESKR